MQLSTKKYIHFDDLEKIISLIKYYGQFIIFVSSATISKHKQIEIDTDCIEKRFKTFSLIGKIPVVLYLKPVLKDITYLDIELYKNYINIYHIKDVVVGSLFTGKISDEEVPFKSGNKLFYTHIEEENKIIKLLTPLCNIYTRSTQVTKYYKEIKGEK